MAAQDGAHCYSTSEGGGRELHAIWTAVECYLLSFPSFTTFVHEGNLIDIIMYKQQSHTAKKKNVIS
jgi:hypothetical protein